MSWRRRSPASGARLQGARLDGSATAAWSFAKHMIVVADLGAGDDGAVEDAVTSAWRLQADDSDDGSAGQPDDR